MGEAPMPWDESVKRRLKLRDLDILIAVVEAGSMGKAADRLGTFQPSISKSIVDLELTLGVRLLDRGSHGVAPTPYAQALVARSRAAFNELKQGVRDIENLTDAGAGELHIAGSEAIIAGIFPTVIARLTHQYPRLSIHVRSVFTDLPEYRALREREVEFIVGRIPRLEAEEDLRVDTLFADPLMIAAGATNRWTRKRSVNLAELMAEPWVIAPPDHYIGSLHASLFRSNGCEPPRHAIVCTSLHMNDALLATGRYLAIYSSSRLQLASKRLSIKPLPVKLARQSSRVGIVTLKNRTLSPTAELFIRRMREIVVPFARIG
jgi:DNA-binding transcriptional LysR family regulator